MYAYLYGEISEIESENLAIDVGGVGYEVYCDMFTLSSVKLGEKVKLYTYLNVNMNSKDDNMTLYGFKEKSAKPTNTYYDSNTNTKNPCNNNEW